MRSILLLFVALTAVAGEAGRPWSRDDDVMVRLPRLPKPVATAIKAPAAAEDFIPGVRVAKGERVVLDGTLSFDQGPQDGMEVLACLKDGKTHESMIRLDTNNGQLIKAAVLAALGPDDGVPAAEAVGTPARGTPVRLTVQWQDQDGHWFEAPASSLVRDRATDQGHPPLPWIYTGSRFVTVPWGGEGGTQKRNVFMLDSTRSVAVNFDEPDALLASPFPGAASDDRFEANSSILPAQGTRLRLVIEAATLPLTLSLAADGSLAHAGQTLADSALDALLGQHYGPTATPALRAVAIAVAADADHALDLAARARVLAAAARAQIWVIPVFVLAK